jgi:hypothetical protein
MVQSMKKNILLVTLLYFGFTKAQSTAIEWQKSLGGSSYEEAKCIQATPDGGYILAGNTTSSNGNLSGIHSTNNSDGWVVKLSSTGTIEWQKCLGGSDFDIFNSIQPTSDGGYIAVGYTNSNNGDVSGNHSASSIGYYPPNHNFFDSTDAWVVKLSSTGTIEWQKCLGGTGTDEAKSVQFIAQGGYIITGYTTSNDGDVSNHRTNIDETTNYPWNTYDISPDAWVVKLTSSGEIVWEKCLDTGNIDNVIFNSEYGESIQPTVDGGYIMSGGTKLKGPDNSINYPVTPWVAKLDSNGNKQWEDINTQCTINGSYTDIQLTTDGGYIMTGYQCESLYVLKINSIGTRLWQKWFGGSNYEGARSIKPTIDGGYIVAGETYSNNVNVTGNHGSYDAWVVRLNSMGDLLWQKCLGGTGFDGANSIQTTTDGGYIMAGFNTSTDGDVSGNNGSKDLWVVKLTSDLPPASTSSQTFCQGATVASLVATGSALRWYTVATGSTALANTAVLTTRTYYVSQTVSGVESLRVPVTVTVNTLPTTPGTIAGTVSQGALVGTTATATYSITPVPGASSYFWSTPTGANIISGQGTTTLVVNFMDVPEGVGNIGTIMVQTVNESGCKSVAKTLMLTKALPSAPSTLILTNGISATAITNISKYTGSTTILKLSAAPVATATSYEWELPAGVNRTDGSGTTTVAPYIFVNFQGVNSLNTSSYTLTSGVVNYVIRIGVMAKNGVGASITNNSNLVNPTTTSTAKLVKLTATIPSAVATVSGQTTSLCGGNTYSYSLTASTTANTYTITAPSGAVVRSANNQSNNQNTLSTSDLSFTVTYASSFLINTTTTSADKTITVTAVNGIGNSSIVKTVTLSTAMPTVSSISGGTTYSNCNQTFTAANVLGAIEYTWIVPAGASIISGQGSSSMVVNYGSLTGVQTLKVKATNACGVSSAVKSITLTRGTCTSGLKQEDNIINRNNTIVLYPNPTRDWLTISNNTNSSIDKVIIIDLLGNIIVENRPTNNKVDVAQFASGTYIIEAYSGQEKFQSKFVKL